MARPEASPPERPRDPRAERSRRAVIDAVETMIARGDTSLTVVDIVRESGVSRSTFYTHFSDLDELCFAILAEAFDHIARLDLHDRRVDGADLAEVTRLGQARIVDHVAAHRQLYAAVFSLPATREVTAVVVRLLAQSIERTVTAVDTRPAGIRPDLAARFVAGGVVALLVAWVRGDVEADRDELVDHLVALFPSWLRDGPV